LPKILELQQHLADLIAAGEVVQRPSSVVKELVENSIDAGAGVITIEISSGGMTYIRVTDDGCGIGADDAKTAFLRHATSKLRDADGLAAIGTLGFRGEALAAIAAVSRVEMLTREHGADEGVSLTLEGGVVTDLSPGGSPEGTTIIVRDLFFNTPARHKFMKSDRAESGSVASVVLSLALSRPDISFRFIKDGKTQYHTPGDSRIDSCVYNLLGREFEAGFLDAESSDEVISVEGFVGTPSAARGNRSYQFFFVNGRAIRSILLQSALEQAYKNSILTGRFPSCVLYLTIKPSDVDVNVHPAKTEVKFVSEKQVFDSVYYAALGALEKAQGVVQSASLFDNSDDNSFKVMHVEDFRKVHVAEPSNVYKSQAVPGLRTAGELSANAPAQKHTLKPVGSAGHDVTDSSEDARYIFSADSLTDFHVSPFRVIGEALNVYIIVEYEGSVWFIDKHAAHERIHFDALKSGDYEPMSESLIIPVVCRLGHESTAILLDNSSFIEELGFTVESFGEDSVAVRHIPSDIDISDTEAVLSDLCLQLSSSSPEANQLDSIYKAIACKAAIKAGRASGMRELEALAARVMSGELSHCPHGRPVAFEMTKSTLDKGFGRI